MGGRAGAGNRKLAVADAHRVVTMPAALRPAAAISSESLGRTSFLAACTKAAKLSNDKSYVHEARNRTSVSVSGVYRAFAAWVSSGEQVGVHLRSEAPNAIKSMSFRGNHNWAYLGATLDDTLPNAIAEAIRIAKKRGGGVAGDGTFPDVYKPLLKAIKLLKQPPTDLHAGGPRAKVLSGEQQLAIELCLRCIERVRYTLRDDEADLLERLLKMHESNAGWDGRWKVANARPYGTDREKDDAAAADSAAVQAARGLIGCYFGSQSASLL